MDAKIYIAILKIKYIQNVEKAKGLLGWAYTCLKIIVVHILYMKR